MTPDAAVARAIDGAYDAFAPYERPAVLDAAPSRDGAAILRTLSAAPLRHLSGEQIGPYSGWAITTVGSEEDYKHFLPRILEQAVRDPAWMGTDPAVIAQRLARAEWRTWPRTERDAVCGLYWAAWEQARQSHPDETSASDWLCGLGALGEDIGKALAQWLSPPSAHAALQVAQLTIAMNEQLSGEEPQDSWSYVTDRRTVLDWLASDGVRATLSDIAHAVAPQDVWQIDAALAVHRRATH